MNPQIEILYKLYEKFWLKTINENFTHKRISGWIELQGFQPYENFWLNRGPWRSSGRTSVLLHHSCPADSSLQSILGVSPFSGTANAKRNGLAFYHSTARMKKVSFISFMHCCLASWRTRFVFQKPPTSCCGTGVAMGGAYYSKSFHPSANSIKLIYSKYLTNFL